MRKMTIRLTPEQYDYVQKEAGHRGLTVSEFVRNLVSVHDVLSILYYQGDPHGILHCIRNHFLNRPKPGPDAQMFETTKGRCLSTRMT